MEQQPTEKHIVFQLATGFIKYQGNKERYDLLPWQAQSVGSDSVREEREQFRSYRQAR